MNIDFITTIDKNDSSGGWNGINYKMYDSLSSLVNINYHGPIDPTISLAEKTISKVLRLLKLRGNYFFFSNSRLRKINAKFQKLSLSGDQVLFFGATPWVLIKPTMPYSVYLDIIFPRYLELFLPKEKFAPADIRRISKMESAFLQNSKHIFWGSNWAMDDAKKNYNLNPKSSTVISTGGHLPILDCSKQKKKNLLFISLDFKNKGGLIAFETFLELKQFYQELELHIIGEKPPKRIFETPGVHYIGLLNKNNEVDMETFINEVSEAFFLIHPTTMDTMGAVIVEAGYYGTPTIAPDNFGIPDLVFSGRTGVLLNTPLNSSDFVKALKFYLENSSAYLQLCENVKEFMRKERSWSAIAAVILNKLKN